MESRYATLKTVYEIVKNEANPALYACFPNQIIIHQSQPWDTIMEQLYVLADEGFLTIQQPGTTICITTKGMEKAMSTDKVIPS